MITEAFLNTCYSCVLNKNMEDKLQKCSTRDILGLLNFYKEKEKTDIPIVIKNKLDCLVTACELRLSDRTPENILDSLTSHGEKYKQYSDYIESKIHEEVDKKTISDNLEQVKIRKRLASLFSNYDKVISFMEDVKSGSFSSIDEITADFETFIKEQYCTFMEMRRGEIVESASSLDLSVDNYDSVIDAIRSKYREETTLTGYDLLDYHLGGGLHKGRLYIWAGGSGSGKSTFLVNMMTKAILSEKVKEKNKKNKSKKVYLYITLENLVDETLMRVYQSMYGVTGESVINEIIDSNGKITQSIKQKIVEKLEDANVSIVVKYFPKFSITPTDVALVIDEVSSTYGADNISAVFLDYLDLLELDTRKNKVYDSYRLELSKITSHLKNIAVEYSVPMVSVSQLGREIYGKTLDAKSLHLGLMSEAIKKVEHADFIGLMAKDETSGSNKVFMKLGKARAAESNISLVWEVDFATFRFKDVKIEDTTNEEKQNNIFSKNKSDRFDRIEDERPNRIDTVKRESDKILDTNSF